MRTPRTISTAVGMVAACALLAIGGGGATAAQASPTAAAAASCSGYTVSGASCALGGRVLAHCHMNGSACRQGGISWRCRESRGAARCSAGHRSVYRPRFAGAYLDELPELEGDGVTRGQVSIDGASYAHGIQMNIGWAMEKEEAVYKVPAGARQFDAVVGNDDNQPDPLWEQIPVMFEVFVDGRRVATAREKGPGRQALPPIAVSGASTLKLVALNVGDEGGGARVDWGEPLFS